MLLLSGDNALWGDNAKKAINLLSEETNASGGINGKKVEIIYEDSKGEAKTAIAAFHKLVDVEQVPAVLGDMVTATTLAVAPLANQSKVILMGISCSAPAVTAAGPFVYRVWPSDLYEGQVFAEWAYKKGYKTIGVAYVNNDYGTGLKDAFSAQIEKLGGKIVVTEAYNATDKDFRPVVVKIKQVKPQAVYIVGYYEDSARLIREAKQTGFSSQLLGTSSSIHEKLFEIAGKASEGFVAAMLNDFDMAKLTPAQESFVKKYRAQYGADPDWAATHAADAYLVVEACLKKGNTTGEAIKNCIDTDKTFEAINSGVSFDDNGDMVNKPIAIKSVRDGKFVDIQ